MWVEAVELRKFLHLLNIRPPEAQESWDILAEVVRNYKLTLYNPTTSILRFREVTVLRPVSRCHLPHLDFYNLT